MRAAWPVALLLLAGCQKQAPFEQRYNDQAAAITGAASNMEAELSTQLEATNAAERALADRPDGAAAPP